jgi:hypothetical protein
MAVYGMSELGMCAVPLIRGEGGCGPGMRLRGRNGLRRGRVGLRDGRGGVLLRPSVDGNSRSGQWRPARGLLRLLGRAHASHDVAPMSPGFDT